MRLFQQRTKVCRFDSARAFSKEYELGEGDFILASRSVYETFFKSLGIKVHVEYKDKYGAGEPTDLMMDALLAGHLRGRIRGIQCIYYRAYQHPQ